MKRISQIGILLFSLTLIFFLPANSFGDGICIRGNCRDGDGTFTFSDGSTYVGEWKNGMKHGKGTLTRLRFNVCR